MAFTFVEYIDITPAIYNERTPVDISALVPITATMAIIYVKTSNYSVAEPFGLCSVSSTSIRTTFLATTGSSYYAHTEAWVKLENRVFHAFIFKNVDLYQSIWLKGYATADDVVMFDDAYDMSLGSVGTPTLMNIGTYVAEGDDCIGGIFEVVNESSAGEYHDFMIQAYGSTDDHYKSVTGHNTFTWVTPCSEGRVCEGEIEISDIKFYLAGYIKAGIKFNINAPLITTSATGAWTDSTAPNSNIGVLVDIVGDDSGWDIYGGRKNGYTGSGISYRGNRSHAQMSVDTDENKIWEYYIKDADTALYLRGEFGNYAVKAGLYENIDDEWVEIITQVDGVSDLSGILPVANGGTNKDSWTANEIIYASATNTLSQITKVNNAILVTNGSGVPSLSATLPSGLTLPGYVKTDGTTPLTANWDVGSYDITMQKLTVDGTTGIIASGVNSSLTFGSLAGSGIHWYSADQYWWLKGWNSGAVYGIVTHCPDNDANRFVALGTSDSVGNVQKWLVYGIGTGLVGVMTNTPDRTLDVLHASNPQLRLTQADNSKYVEFKADSDSYLTLYCASSEALHIRANALYGGTGSGGNLTLDSTSHATKGQINFNSNIVQADGLSIATDKIIARDSGGAKLYEDSGNYGVYVADNGCVIINHNPANVYFDQGIRIPAGSNGYCTLSLCAAGTTGTDTNQWDIISGANKLFFANYGTYFFTADYDVGLAVTGNSGSSGGGIIFSAKDASATYSFPAFVMYTDDIDYGGRITGSRTAALISSYGLVNGITIGPLAATQDIGFRVGASLTGTHAPAMVILSTYQIGVGFTAPSAKFCVNGSANFGGESDPGGFNVLFGGDIEVDGALNHDGTTVGFYGTTPVAQGAGLTAQLTTITCSAPGTPDYAIADPTQTTPFGFTTSDEMLSMLKVIANLQTRVAELEARLGTATGVGLFT